MFDVTPEDRLASNAGSKEFLHSSGFTIGTVVDLTGGGGGRSRLRLLRNKGGGGMGGAPN